MPLISLHLRHQMLKQNMSDTFDVALQQCYCLSIIQVLFKQLRIHLYCNSLYQVGQVGTCYFYRPAEAFLDYNLDSVLVGIIAIGLYSAFLFLPGHAVMMKHFFDHMFMDDTPAGTVQAT